MDENMNQPTERNRVLRKLFFAGWGMLTLVLLFSIAFLVNALVQRGVGTVDLSNLEPPALTTEPRPGTASETREIRLYFADPNDVRLVSERRRIEFGEYTVDNCRQVLEALIQGPRGLLAPVISPTTHIRGMYLRKDGELVLDLSRDVETGLIGSVSAELLMFQSIATSLTQPDLKGDKEPAVRRIRFLFEGSPPQDSFPKHIELTDSITADWDLVRAFGNVSQNV